MISFGDRLVLERAGKLGAILRPARSRALISVNRAAAAGCFSRPCMRGKRRAQRALDVNQRAGGGAPA
jgi:hypothetical protein